ncbi:MAG: hypothetical protein HQ495_15730 [Alphaproteobacteria bacterium]|nr:hypothetical protein [Alphaproteobacteria bacterium]
MKNYALVIPLTGSIQDACQKAWELIDFEYNAKYISSRCPFPYLPLYAGSTKRSAGEVFSAWEKGVSSETFDLKSDGLGVILFNSPILYVRWLRTDALSSLYAAAMKAYNPICSSPAISTQPEYWTPKTTLAGTDTSVDDLSGMLKCIEGIGFFQNTRVTELAIIEYDERRESVVSCFSLEG